MNTYRVTKPARADLREIWNYVAGHSEYRADRLLDDLTDHFQAIAEQPLLLGHKDIIYGTEHRITPIRGYVIFFEPTDDGADIIRVIHGARDPSDLFAGD